MSHLLNSANIRKVSAALYALTLLFFAPLSTMLWALPFILFTGYFTWTKFPVHLVVLQGFEDDEEVICFVQEAEQDFDAVIFVRKTDED